MTLPDFGPAKAFGTRCRGARELAANDALANADWEGDAGGRHPGDGCVHVPEQARGKPVDKRTDIWASERSLWEMLTAAGSSKGRPSDMLAAVLRQDLDFAALPGETPDGIVRLLHRCPERDPKSWLHDIADARLEIEESLRTPHLTHRIEGGGEAPEVAGAAMDSWLFAAASSALALATDRSSSAANRRASRIWCAFLGRPPRET